MVIIFSTLNSIKMNPELERMVSDFAELVRGFRYEEAHQRFYHASLIKHENEDAPTIVLEAHRIEKAQILSNISQSEAKLLTKIVSDDTSVLEWHYQFEHKEWGRRNFRELSVQRWKEGKIIHERHHYKSANW